MGTLARDKEDYAFLQGHIKALSGIVLHAEQEPTVRGRLQALLREESLPDISALVARLSGAPDRFLEAKLMNALTTNETYFFRDIYPFEALRTVVLPALLPPRQAGKPLVIWVAACSTGQEAYSIAMVIQEHFPKLAKDGVRILASDISTEMVRRTRTGIYSDFEVARGMSQDVRERFFKRDESGWNVRDEIRQMVECFEFNLNAPAWSSLPQVDIVFLRNVMIYFDVDSKRGILGRIGQLLAPDGFLFLGAAETTLRLHDSFVRVPLLKAGCYCRRDTLPFSLGSGMESFPPV